MILINKTIAHQKIFHIQLKNLLFILNALNQRFIGIRIIKLFHTIKLVEKYHLRKVKLIRLDHR